MDVVTFSTPTLGAATVRALGDALDGEVVAPGDDRYDAARAVWNATVDRHPAAVAYCVDVGDVVAALRFARGHDLVVAVRSGGHSVPGYSVCDGGIVIDLSRLRGVVVDPHRRVARVAGGSLLGDLDAAAQAYDMVCPVGAVTHTGVAGLTLGGGLGRLMRRYGLTVDSLRVVELVTADGRCVRASAEENPGLFWGLRGAGANFGIATAFEFDLHPLEPVVTAGALIYNIERAAEVGQLVRTLPDTAPDELVVSMSWAPSPAEPPFDPAMAGRPIAVCSVTYSGPVGEADRVLQPLRALGPVVDTVGPTRYLDLQRSTDDVMAWGQRYYWKGAFVTDLSDELLGVAVDHSVDVPSPHAGVSLMTLGGAIDRVPAEHTAFAARAGRFWLMAEAVWDHPADDATYLGWGRDAMAAMAPFTMDRNYANDMGRVGTDALRTAYGDDHYARLVALKRIWDPDNVLRSNHNIDPSAAWPHEEASSEALRKW